MSSLFLGFVTVAILTDRAEVVWVAPFPNGVFLAVCRSALVTCFRVNYPPSAANVFVFNLFLHNCKYDNTKHSICQELY
jgi:hypothetical protein